MALRKPLCHVSELVANHLQAFTVDGVTWPVLATILDGEVVATAGVCPHEDVSLVGGQFVDGTVVCPGHGLAFDVRTGKCAGRASMILRRYKVTVIDDIVWVDLL